MRIILGLTICLFGVLHFGSSTSAQNGATSATSPSTTLEKYVSRDEPAFKWNLVRKMSSGVGSVFELRVTSQQWHDTTWEHAVEVFEPKNLRFEKEALLFVTGGSTPRPPSPIDVAKGLQLASACGARVVMLHQTPNQPLLGNRKEDDLISETWLRYLDTGDETWPLLFPMVKSAVKTMDAIEEFSQQELGTKIERFVITGASKRGWTSWLTPVVDQRVIGTAPIVIDVLNFREQMKHQLETWGFFSVQIRDYTTKGLVKRPDETESEREIKLRKMMDPYQYRAKLALPKLLIVGTNDPYWVVDAMNLYWDDLAGPKYIRQIPNAGHGLEGGLDDAIASLAAFFGSVAGGKPMPKVAWHIDGQKPDFTLTIESDIKPKAVRIWQSHSTDNDFRDDRWKAKKAEGDGDVYVGKVDRVDGKRTAVFGEIEFEDGGTSWSVTTLVYRK